MVRCLESFSFGCKVTDSEILPAFPMLKRGWKKKQWEGDEDLDLGIICVQKEWLTLWALMRLSRESEKQKDS